MVVKAEDLPQPLVVIGKDGKERYYQLMPAKKHRGAQLCAVHD